MAEIIFFEKTGCINNTKQKKILAGAGHNVKAINLLKHDWTEDELLLFFSKLDVKDWFNRNAPEVKSGKIIPENFSRLTAIQVLLDNHLLIRRPLLIIQNQTLVGFNKKVLDELVGLKTIENSEIAVLLTENLDDCPQKANATTCS